MNHRQTPVTRVSAAFCGNRRTVADWRCVCTGTTRRFFSRPLQTSLVAGRCLCESRHKTAGGWSGHRNTTNARLPPLPGPAASYRKSSVFRTWRGHCTRPRLNARRKLARRRIPARWRALRIAPRPSDSPHWMRDPASDIAGRELRGKTSPLAILRGRPPNH